MNGFYGGDYDDDGNLIPDRVPDDWAAELSEPAYDPHDPRSAPLSLADRLLPGGAILDVPPVPAAVWGDDDDILWAEGQAVIIAGPDGVGKTTLAGNLIQARLGIGTGTVLGLPVRPGERNVLVLLMDRPQQAMAALARLFTEADRELLDARVRIWRGPPPQDLARNTGLLAELCKMADADTCLVDSLKDAALKLSDDETGAGWNQARQLAIVAGTELVELHHPRKGQEGNRKPSKLDDLYGSRWIPAGAGSVISLWGQAGDPVVDFSHLKPVVATAGPWQMKIDGQTGLVSRDHGVDLLEQIRYRPDGITATIAARLITGTETPGRSEVEKARRKLDKKAAQGLLVRLAGRRGGADRAETTYYLASAQPPPEGGESNHGSNHAPVNGGAITEAITDQTRAGQAITHTQEPEQSRDGGNTSYPIRDRWPAASVGASVNE